jgi:hypothetical protein
MIGASALNVEKYLRERSCLLCPQVRSSNTVWATKDILRESEYPQFPWDVEPPPCRRQIHSFEELEEHVTKVPELVEPFNLYHAESSPIPRIYACAGPPDTNFHPPHDPQRSFS